MKLFCASLIGVVFIYAVREPLNISAYSLVSLDDMAKAEGVDPYLKRLRDYNNIKNKIKECEYEGKCSKREITNLINELKASPLFNTNDLKID